MKNKLLNTDIDKICELYLNGYSSLFLSKLYGYTPQGIRYQLKKRNIKFRLSHENSRIYSLNEEYFENINNNNKSYFLGLLFADGCNTGNGVKLSLKEDDVDIIKKFIKDIGYGGNIKTEKRIGGFSKCSISKFVNIHSKKISSDLTKLGCIKNKTHFCEFPNIDIIYYHHFIRGYFDGDGCCYIDKKNNKKIIFTGNDLIISKINDILSEKCEIKKSKLYNKKNTKSNIVSIYFNGNKICNKIKNFLYKDSDDLFLIRKKIKLDNIKIQ